MNIFHREVPSAPLTPSAENKAEADKGKIKGVPQDGFRDGKGARSTAQASSLTQLHILGPFLLS